MPPLQVAQPVGDEAQFHQSASGQDTDARLWQDPFAAVAKAEADHKNPLNCEGQDGLHCRMPIDQLSESNDLDGVKTLFVLAVNALGAPYVEAEEDRRRAHYAIVSGLNRIGFSPDDAQHVGFFHKDPKSVQPNEPRSRIMPIADATGSELASNVLPITIPFELFVDKTPSDQKSQGTGLVARRGQASELSACEAAAGIFGSGQADRSRRIRLPVPGDRGEDCWGVARRRTGCEPLRLNFSADFMILRALIWKLKVKHARTICGTSTRSMGRPSSELATEDSNDIAKLEAYDHHDDLRK
jgi:hypothetical protein